MTSTPKGMPDAESEVVTPAGLALPPDALVAAAAEGLIEQAKATGVALSGEGGLLTGLVGRVPQGALESEVTGHLAIESLNSRFRKAAVRWGHFPTDQAALKVLYLVSIEKRKNRSNPTGRINGWKNILNTWSCPVLVDT